MLQEIFLRKLNTQSKTVCNAIITLGDTDDSGKGRKFKSRFLTPGVAGYPGQFGNVLIKKETFDKFINSMVGVPVIVNHKDLSKDNADDERVGVVSNVWFDEKDGWYWCEGVIWDETAINLIQDKGWSVSCSYDVKLADDTGGTENNIPYDIEFLDGVFTHLAIVDNPRYERANIVFNSKIVINNQFTEEDHPRDEQGKFTSGGNGVNPNYKTELQQVIDKAKSNPIERQKLVIGKVAKDLEEKAKDNGFDISGYQHDLDVSGTRHAIKEHGQPKTEEPRGQIAITDEDFEKIPDVIYGYDEVAFTGKNKIGRETITYKKAFDDGTILYVEEIRDKRKTLTINTLYKQKNTGNPRTFVENNNPLSNASIHIISDIQDDFNPSVQNIKEHKLLQDLKKIVSSVENDKWITIHPNGEENKGRPLLLKDGETPKEAIERTYGHPNKYIGKTFKSGNRELKVEKYDKNKNWYSVAVVGDENKKSTTHYYYSEKDLEKALEIDKKNKDFEERMKESPQKSFDFSKEQLKAVQKLLEQMVKDENKTIKSRTNNNKEQDMALIEELKKLITKVENDKGEDMDDTKEKVDNEKVDKRDIIRQIMAIAGKHEDNEDVRTIAKLAEKLAYDRSEAGAADNKKEDDEPKDEKSDNKKVKNEETKEDKEKYNDLKKEVKEDIENKCKNSIDNSKGGFFDKMNEIYNSAMKPKEENIYVSRADKLKAAEEYFAK